MKTLNEDAEKLREAWQNLNTTVVNEFSKALSTLRKRKPKKS